MAGLESWAAKGGILCAYRYLPVVHVRGRAAEGSGAAEHSGPLAKSMTSVSLAYAER